MPEGEASPGALRGRRIAARWALLPGVLAALCAGFVHRSILDGFFFDDDFAHLYRIVDHGFLSFVLTPHCGHVLAARNVLFFGFHRAFGLDAQAYFAVVLLTHVLNVALLFSVLRHWTGRAWLAGGVALLWGASPIGQGTLSWYSVYGHCVVATALLWILWDVARLEGRAGAVPKRMLARWYLLLLFASASFGVGIAVALLAGPSLYCLLPKAENRLRIAIGFGTLAGVVPALYFGMQRLFQASNGAASLDAGLPGLASLPQVLDLTLHLLAYGFATLVFGGLATANRAVLLVEELPLSLDAAYGIFFALLAAAFLAAAWAARGAGAGWRLRVLALGAMAVAAYGLIAVGRLGYVDALGHTVAAFAIEARYHYVAPALLAIVLGLVLARLSPRDAGRWGAVLAFVWLCLLLNASGGAITAIRATLPNERRDAFQQTVEGIRRAVEGTPAGEDVVLANDEFRGVFWGKRTQVYHCRMPLYPGRMAVFVTAFPENSIEGRRVYFAESDPAVVAEIRKSPDTRAARLLLDASRQGGPGGRRKR